MVLREQFVNKMEIEGITIVDSRKTYVVRARTTDVPYTNTLSILQLGQAKVRFCTSPFYVSVQRHSWGVLDPQLFKTSNGCMQPDWP